MASPVLVLRKHCWEVFTVSTISNKRNVGQFHFAWKGQATEIVYFLFYPQQLPTTNGLWIFASLWTPYYPEYPNFPNKYRNWTRLSWRLFMIACMSARLMCRPTCGIMDEPWKQMTMRNHVHVMEHLPVKTKPCRARGLPTGSKPNKLSPHPGVRQV